MKLISYLCAKFDVMNGNSQIRELLFSDEFASYYDALTPDIQKKFDYVMNVIRTERVLNSKFIKKLEGTEFYEMRVSVRTNEYRSVVFSINSDNIINATQILLLNTFLKKSTKDYKKNIYIAEKIINKYI